MKRNLRTRVNSVEQLESRAMMATFGIAWPNPSTLSVSFPSDNASIGAYPNQLRESLDQVADRLKWQEAVLRAFQTWSVHSNINIGLVPDRGDRFGATGLAYDDPRFGEFRIGAFPQSNVVANALPYQPVAGSWSGDLFLDTSENYFLHDAAATGPVQVPNPIDNAPAVELYSVLLHEAGNALGLADNNILGTVMNGTYSGPNTRLKNSDISAIQQLYGRRRDPHEISPNNTRATATQITFASSFGGSSPISTQGRILSNSDVDFYRFKPLAGKDKVTIRLWASGISLLKSRLEVLDNTGKKIADVKADSIFENNLQLEIGSLKDHRELFIRVASNAQDVFGIGDYRIDIDYRDPSLQPNITPPSFDSDADDGDDDSVVDYISVDELFRQFGSLDNELGTNDTLTSATQLVTTVGFLPNTKYDIQSALSAAMDRDLWRFRSPSQATAMLHITVDPVGSTNPSNANRHDLEVIVMNSKGDRVAAQQRTRPDGGITLDIARPERSVDYILFVRSAGSSVLKSGNYVVNIDFATYAGNDLATVFTTDLNSSQDHISSFKTYKTQLFRFELRANSPSANEKGQLSLYNARTGDLVASFAAAANSPSTEYLWLEEGTYYFRTSLKNRFGDVPAPTRFSLRATVLSDDQGPVPANPMEPINPFPDWDWSELSPTIPPPVINVVEPPFINPWESDTTVTFEIDFYKRVLA